MSEGGVALQRTVGRRRYHSGEHGKPIGHVRLLLGPLPAPGKPRSTEQVSHRVEGSGPGMRLTSSPSASTCQAAEQVRHQPSSVPSPTNLVKACDPQRGHSDTGNPPELPTLRP